MKIIFVGIHNKPGMTPLDSKSKSGQLIDKIIEQLKVEEVVKSNLFDTTYLPKGFDPDVIIANWKQRTGWTKEDTVVLLGAFVSQVFKNGQHGMNSFISIDHPGSIIRHSRTYMDTYISVATSSILLLKKI